MKAFVTGSFVTLTLMGVGLFWWQGRAEVEAAAPPPDPMAFAPAPFDPDKLPITDPGDMEGPASPEASELTKEQNRFFRTTAIATGASHAAKCSPPVPRLSASSTRTATTSSPSRIGL